MKQSFCCLPSIAAACLLLVAGGPLSVAAPTAAGLAAAQHGPVGSTASGDVLLDSAINRLERHESVSARVRLQARFFGNEIFGAGRYLQRGRGAERQIRFELSIPTTATKNVMISVSDGRQWWRYLEVREEQELTVVDLTAVRAAMANARADKLLRANIDTIRGGLPQTLQRLLENFQFAPATPANRNESVIWVTRGRWRPDQLQQRVGTTDQEEARKISRQLSARLPHEVVVFLHDGSLFPQRIEYLGKASEEAGGMTRRVLATIEFFEIHFDRLLDDTHFQQPREMVAQDVTQRYLKEIGLVNKKRR